LFEKEVEIKKAFFLQRHSIKRVYNRKGFNNGKSENYNTSGLRNASAWSVFFPSEILVFAPNAVSRRLADNFCVLLRIEHF